jgi:ACS family 4-hydroxyphenylacetate permease-like MFS transporter
VTDFPSGTPARTTSVAAAVARINPVVLRSAANKVSRRLLWLLFALFFCWFLCRISIGFAGLTMPADLGLTITQFGFATALFYLAYLAFSVPASLMLVRVGARRGIGWIMIAGGLVSSATMLATGAYSLYALRILSGVIEAGFLPGMLLYLSQWFPAAYRGRVTVLFMIALPVAEMVGAAASGYILQLDGAWGLWGWQWLFLLSGAPALIFGFVALALLRNSPQQAKWLAPAEQRALAHVLDAEHQAANARGAQTSFWKELFSPTTINYALIYLIVVNTLAMIAIWTPLLVKTISPFGSNNVIVGYLAAIPPLVTIAMMIMLGYYSDRLQERKWHLFGPMVVSALGWLLAAYAGDSTLKLLGVCLASGGAYTAMAIFWTTPDYVFSHRSRVAGIAVISAFGNIGSGFNPLMVGFLRDFTDGFSASMAYSAILMILAAGLALTLPISRKELASRL